MEPTAVSPTPVPAPGPVTPAPQPVATPVPVAVNPKPPVAATVVPTSQPTVPVTASPTPAPTVVAAPTGAPTSAPAPVSVAPARPVAMPASPLVPEVTLQPMPDQSQRPKRILLVEDDDALANVYLMRLEAESFDVYRVANGEDALVSALQYHPDIVLLDVMMPRVSGFEVLDILRNTPETANLKVIMLTALSQESDKQRAQKLGVNDYLVKSQVVIADVIARIKYHLGMA